MISQMPKVVSNTTPLISLLKISRLDILRELYKEITIPFAVYQEIEAGKSKDYYQDLSNVSRAAYISKNWLRSRFTIDFLDTWEQINNPGLKVNNFPL